MKPDKARTVKARKNHKCNFCGHTILKNTKYIPRRFGPHNTTSDCFWTCRGHPLCDKIAQATFDFHDWEEYFTTNDYGWFEGQVVSYFVAKQEYQEDR